MVFFFLSSSSFFFFFYEKICAIILFSFYFSKFHGAFLFFFFFLLQLCAKIFFLFYFTKFHDAQKKSFPFESIFRFLHKLFLLKFCHGESPKGLYGLVPVCLTVAPIYLAR